MASSRSNVASTGSLSAPVHLTVEAAFDLLASLRKRLTEKPPTVRLDLSQVEDYQLGALSALEEMDELARRQDATLELYHPNAALLKALESLPAPPPQQEKVQAQRPGFFERIGAATVEGLEAGLGVIDFVMENVLWLLRPATGRRRIRGGLTVEQMLLMGVEAVGIVLLITFLVGSIMGLQAAYQLRQFGADIFVADLVGVSMTRELGPLIAAIIVSGRTGSAIAAELGTMQVAEEVDALRTIGVSPIEFLVIPRLVALVIVLPCLTVLANLSGILGGLAIGVGLLQLPVVAYWNETLLAIYSADLITGLIKASVFGSAIGLTGCYFGLGVRGGASGVGVAATRAVVVSIFLTIILDGVFTTLFYLIGA